MTKKKHGLYNHPLYYVWANMVDRCHNKKSKPYKWYGERGIRVADEWRDITNFVRDVEPLYTKGLSIDRIDNDKGYEPGNIRFSNNSTQNINRRQKPSKSGVVGIRKRTEHSGWDTSIRIFGKIFQIGSFCTADEASKARMAFVNYRNHMYGTYP